MFGKKRRQLFVDSTLQGALLSRCVLYWGMCLAAVFVSLLCWDLVVGPTQVFYTRVENTWFKYAPAMLFVAALTPVMAFDFLRMSNRFAGPMIRLRRAMRDLGQGERVEPVVLRRNDFWRDFSDEFNSVVLRMRKLEADLAAAKSEIAAANEVRDGLTSEAGPTSAENASVESDAELVGTRSF
jgi:methyl-accepting chemotaxis protein